MSHPTRLARSWGPRRATSHTRTMCTHSRTLIPRTHAYFTALRAKEQEAMYALPKCDWFHPRIACDCVCRYSPLTLKKETAFATKKKVI